MGGAVIASVSEDAGEDVQAAGQLPAGPGVVNGPVRQGCCAMAKQPGGVTRLDRRAFLRTVGAATGAAAVGGIPDIVAAQKAPSFPKGTKLNILEWVSFVPASDVEFKRLAAEFGKLAGVDVTVDLINMNDLNPRIASAIETMKEINPFVQVEAFETSFRSDNAFEIVKDYDIVVSNYADLLRSIGQVRKAHQLEVRARKKQQE